MKKLLSSTSIILHLGVLGTPQYSPVLLHVRKRGNLGVTGVSLTWHQCCFRIGNRYEIVSMFLVLTVEIQFDWWHLRISIPVPVVQ